MANPRFDPTKPYDFLFFIFTRMSIPSIPLNTMWEKSYYVITKSFFFLSPGGNQTVSRRRSPQQRKEKRFKKRGWLLAGLGIRHRNTRYWWKEEWLPANWGNIASKLYPSNILNHVFHNSNPGLFHSFSATLTLSNGWTTSTAMF